MLKGDMIIMSDREARRLPVLEKLAGGEVTQRGASETLGLSERQIRRLLRRYEWGGAAAITHLSRWKPSPRRIAEATRLNVLELCRTKYVGFGPTFASEKLLEHEGIRLSDETLRNWMVAEGLWKPGRRGKRTHPRRERRECFGELLQMDGSHHDWFEGRGQKLVLMGCIDDATGDMHGKFHDYEGTVPAMETFREHALLYGLPMAVYVDKHSTYKSPVPQGQSQFERAMEGLGVEVIHAGSPQAKGRVERSFGTHQDRLVKEMRLRGISTMDEANEFLAKYWARHNVRFRVQAKSEADAHVPVSEGQLDEHLCIKEDRTVRNDGTFSFEGGLYLIEGSVRGPVEVRVGLGGGMWVRWRGEALKFRAIAERPKKVVKPSPRKTSVTIPSDGHPWKRPSRNANNRYVWANAY